MAWWTSRRIPEPEVMGEAEEVSAYVSAADQDYLDGLDDTFVDQVLEIGLGSGLVLDLGTGPGGIPLKVARRNPQLRVVGLDRSLAMIRTARQQAEKQNLLDRVFFLSGDANRICFPDGNFDLVVSNSLLHHLADPIGAFREMARVTRRGGWILLRDLRRPSRWLVSWHVRRYGRHYAGLMRELYEASVRASYTLQELVDLLRRVSLGRARTFSFRRTHIGFLLRSD